MVMVHSETYRGFGLHTFVHRARLARLMAIIEAFELPNEGVWADFGCSDGFILSCVQKHLPSADWQLIGFDHSEKLLCKAKERELANSQFTTFELSQVSKSIKERFDVVSCFETLEHIGNYRNAFDNLFHSTKNSGLMIVSVPNEVGLPGLLKFMGRKLIRKDPYSQFFNTVDSNEVDYICALLRGKNMETFRDPNIESWGPHLGFDYRNLEAYSTETYIKQGKIELLQKGSVFLGFNKIYVYRKKSY